MANSIASAHPVILSNQPITDIAKPLVRWQKKFGRKNLPWQQQSPYQVWVSEIMLQQTQVNTVIPYFQQFIAAFPSIDALANMEQSEVLHYWSGLGYYARARNLHRTAQILKQDHNSQLPDNLSELIALPGIGRSTAGAIRSLGMGKYGVILDGNVKRVLSRCLGIQGWTTQTATLKLLWSIAENITPKCTHPIFNQGMMDLGATICTRNRPSCLACPLQNQCYAFKHQMTDQLPSTKPKTTKPKKSKHFLVLCNKEEALFMMQRPEKGLWGGLWSFLEFSSKKELVDFCKAVSTQSATQATTPQKLMPSFDHHFTHFSLRAHIWTFSISTKHLPKATREQLTQTNRATQINRDNRQTENKKSNSQPLLWYDLKNPAKVGLSRLADRVLAHAKEMKDVTNT